MGSVVSWLNDIYEDDELGAIYKDDELGAIIVKLTKVCGLYRGYIYVYKHIHSIYIRLL